MSAEPASEVADLDVKILGPLEVRTRNTLLDLRRDKERMLLAILALRRGQVVSLGQIASGLWEDAENRPPATLRVHVSRLRRSITERALAADQIIATSAHGYSLQVPPTCVDAGRFEQLAAEGRRAQAAGATEEAAAVLGSALAEWRGSALAGLVVPLPIQPDVIRLEETRLAVLEDRVEADLACGRHRELLGELEQLIAECPLRERLWAQRIVALYRSGRQADALRAYGDLRTLLLEELGISPSPELRELEHLVLEQDPSLEAPVKGRTTTRTLVSRTASSEMRSLAQSSPSHDQTRTVPFPPRLARHLETSLCGRAVELDRILAACKEAEAGGCHLVLVSGEAGIGKTRLVADAAQKAFEADSTVLFGQCDEDLGVPFQPFAEALDFFVRFGPSAESLGRLSGELVRLVPELAQAVPALTDAIRADPDTERFRLFDAVASWLAASSEAAPTVLVLDDLHWAEKPTLLMLRHLMRSSEDTRLLVIATYRDTDIDRTHPLQSVLADLGRETRVVRLNLGGLEPAVVLEVVGRADPRLAEARTLADRVGSLTNGNPFFVQEILRGLAESGRLALEHLDEHGDIDIGGVDIPEGVREVVRGRLQRLSVPTQRALALAAVVGPVLDFDLVRDLTGLDDEEVLDALDEACAAALLHESASGAYEFTHGLVRDTLYSDLGTERRARRHLQVAEALAARESKDAVLLAYHFSRARPIDPRVVDYIADAAELALARLAFDQAADLFAQALTVAEEAAVGESRRCAIKARLGRAQRLAGIAGSRETLLAAGTEARRLGEASLLAAVALEVERGFPAAASEWDKEQSELTDAAIASVPPGDSAVRARLLSTKALGMVWNDLDGSRLQLADEAVAMARRLDDQDCLLEVWVSAHVTCSGPDRVSQLVAEIPALLELAERAGDPQEIATACGWGSIHYLELGDFGRSGQLVDRIGALAAEVAYPLYHWLHGLYRCCRQTVFGTGDEIEAAALEAFQLGADLELPDRPAFFAAQLGTARWAQGRLGEMVDVLRQVAADTPSLAAYQAGLVTALAVAGRRAEAASMLADLMYDIDATVPRNISWLVTHSLLAEAIGMVGTEEQAKVEYEILAPYEGRIPSIGIIARPAVSLWLGVLAVRAGWDDSAQQHFSAAHEQHEKLGAPLWLARTRLEWGRFLLGKKDDARALDLLTDAGLEARRLGATDIAEAAEELLASG